MKDYRKWELLGELWFVVGVFLFLLMVFFVGSIPRPAYPVIMGTMILMVLCFLMSKLYKIQPSSKEPNN